MYFVITNASDKKFARKFGTIRADSLEEAPAAAVETAIFKKGKWTFFEDPGLVKRFDPRESSSRPRRPRVCDSIAHCSHR